MTNEQREAIELLERIHASYFLSGMIEQSNYIVDKAYETDKAIDTVLSLIKEQEEQLDKKDKQIDLMAERIEWLCKSNGILLDKEHDENFTQEDVKQYFERKVEDVKD